MWISETFASFQGTGHLAGTRQFFVRMAGCSVACPIRGECDEPGSLTRKQAQQVRAGDVIEQAVAAVGERGWLHVTGGEPTDQPDALQELVKQARRVGMYVHVQSSGVRRVPVQWDWLTISPKIDEPVQAFGQEMVVIDNGSVHAQWLQQLKATTSFWSYYLCPLWGRDMAYTASLAADAQWDLTWQMHKHAGLR